MRIPLWPLLLPLMGCHQPPPAPAEAIRPVKVVEVRREPDHGSFLLPGTVQARWAAPWSFRVGGLVIQRHVEVGQRVAQGDLVALLDDADLRLQVAAQQANVAAAEAEVALARSEEARVQSLFQRKLASPSERDQAVRALAAAAARRVAVGAALDEARQQAGYARLTAPEAGIVTALHAEAGQVVAAGQAVLTVARLEGEQVEREIALALPESRLAAFPSARLEVRLLALPGRRWSGRLREVAPAADPATRTFAARVALEAPGPEVALGMSAEVRAVAGLGEVMRLPLTALASRDAQPRVWRVRGDDRVEGVAVILGPPRGEEVIVTAGLAPGDRVVVAGAHLMREGLVVRPVPAGDGP